MMSWSISRWLMWGLISSLLIPRLNAAGSFLRYTFERPQMGVPFKFVCYSDQGPAHARAVADKVWDRIEALNAILSNYETDSELSQLGYGSGQGQWVEVSDPLWSVILHAQQLSAQSDGLFDFTLGPATSLWRKARREGRLPDDTTLQFMLSKSGWQHLVLRPEDRRVCLTVPGMRLDPGGIAKGYALDEGLKVAKELGIEHALLSGGGDMAALGAKPDGQAWEIRMAQFGDMTGQEALLPLKDAALATSGDLFQFVEIDGRRYSHILHPKTGIGLTRRTLVTVHAPTGMEADSLATTLSVMGPDRAPAWLQHHAPGVRVRMLWLDTSEALQSWTSEGFGRGE